jgi:quinol-cytochrome oxidoreductase complex cytochrome b subunit
MLKVFFTGAYKPPRELHWLTGVVLLLLVLAMSFSGYLLPWSQLSYWASTVGTEAPRSIPVIGDRVVEAMRGGEHVDGNTLSLFFALHVAVVPAIIVAFMVGHFLMIRRTGIARPL